MLRPDNFPAAVCTYSTLCSKASLLSANGPAGPGPAFNNLLSNTQYISLQQRNAKFYLLGKDALRCGLCPFSPVTESPVSHRGTYSSVSPESLKEPAERRERRQGWFSLSLYVCILLPAGHTLIITALTLNLGQMGWLWGVSARSHFQRQWYSANKGVLYHTMSYSALEGGGIYMPHGVLEGNV